ncbi:MAG: hypothetical protein WD078_09045 [Woeseia sp.]
MELPYRYSGTAGSRILGTALAGAAFVTLCFGPQTAAAAASAIDNDDRIVAELRSLEVEAESLSLDMTDPAANDDQDDLDTPLANDPVAPVLRLTPRVATILREVFGPDVLATPETDATADDTGQDSETLKKTSPLASETAPAATSPDLAGARSNFYLPRFQRQMYRTDI